MVQIPLATFLPIIIKIANDRPYDQVIAKIKNGVDFWNAVQTCSCYIAMYY